jgi:hypothetical protein
MFQALLDVFPTITFLKNDWTVEDGMAGIWVAEVNGSSRTVQSMHWDEGCLEERVHRFREK